MIEVAELPVKDITVGTWAAKLRYQIGVASILQGNNRVFPGIGIQVADNEHVSVAAAGGIGRQPVGQGLSSQRARAVAVALTRGGIVIASTTARALALEVIDHHGEACPAGYFFKRLSQRRAVAGVNEARVNRRCEYMHNRQPV
jgi:hypothetical protein